MSVVEALYPMSIYVYNADGYYGEPVIIRSEEQLYSPRTKTLLRLAMHQGVEIRIIDPNDFCLFQANEGRIIFDGKNICA